METILIATDFSSAARCATKYGFELSKALNAKVILFTAYQMPSLHPESLVYLPTTDLEKLSYQQLADEAERFDSHATVRLETHCLQGPVAEAILSVATQYDVSYIILGMKQSVKELRRFFGSTITLLTKKSSIPLIVVPEGVQFNDVKKIAFASDINSGDDVSILDPLKKIAVTFNSQVSIVRVIKRREDDAAERLLKSERLDWYFTCLNHSFEYLSNDNVARSLNTFVEENAANLVAVIPHEHTFIERLFTRSITKELIFQSHVPLLILLDKKKDDFVADVFTAENAYTIY